MDFMVEEDYIEVKEKVMDLRDEQEEYEKIQTKEKDIRKESIIDEAKKDIQRLKELSWKDKIKEAKAIAKEKLDERKIAK